MQIVYSQKILDLYHAGLSKVEIIKLTKISKTSVYRILAKNGFGKTKDTSLSATLEKQILNLYRLGFGSRLICDRLNIKKTRKNIIYKVLAKYDVDVRPQGGSSSIKPLIPKIVDLYEQGMGCKVIAKTLGISKSTATKYIKKYCKVRSKKRPSVRPKRERDKLFLAEIDYFNRVAYCEWRDSDKRISLEDFKQSAYVSALRAAELWTQKATFRTYAVKCINFGFLKLYKQNPKMMELENWYRE